MTVANLATYPARRSTLQRVIERLAPQVGRLNVILNEYSEVPPWDVPQNVHFILPPSDLKDVGKFFPHVAPNDIVFLVDDDIVYPPDYVARTLQWLRKMPNDRYVVGYHGSIYKPCEDRDILERKVFHFKRKLNFPIVVDQIGTGTLATWGRHMPSFDYMRTSQKFVDVRMARWCLSNNLKPICLPRKEQWLNEIAHDETIYESYTSCIPPAVEAEIRSFALRRKQTGKRFNVWVEDLMHKLGT